MRWPDYRPDAASRLSRKRLVARRDRWTLKEPNDAPPGVCCAQQNVFDDALGKFIRFPSFSGSHGWQSRREIDLKNSSVWTYDAGTNTWRAMRPCPEVWPLARTQAPVVTGVIASVAGPRRVELRWEKPPAEDVVGYHVDRAHVAVYSSAQVRMINDRYRPVPERGVGRIRRIGPFQRLTREAIAATQLADDSLDLASGPVEPPEPGLIDRPLYKEQLNAEGKPYPLAVYAYRVVAVNRLGVAGGPSPLVFTSPSAPQHVFSKEEGKDKTRLRWKANPEKSLAGYLVYRYDGRWDKDTVTRLTPRPIPAAEFFDETAGRGTRRYEIVAVDALGQEGEPSQPIWSRREWGPYYVPYTGPWHQ